MLDLDRDSTHGQPARWRSRSTIVDDGLEEMRWMDAYSRGQELAGGVLRYPPQPEKKHILAIRDGYTFLAIRDGYSRKVVLVDNVLIYFVHTSGQCAALSVGPKRLSQL